MTNLATHDIDRVQFVMKATAPTMIYSAGGRLCLEDDGETPDTQDTLFNYPGFTLLHSFREGNAGGEGNSIRFFGTKGTASLGERNFDVRPEMKGDPADQIPHFNGHPPGGPVFTNTKPVPWIAAEKVATQEDSLILNKRDFLESIRTRKMPFCDIEVGHRVSAACHLGNISLKLGRALRWDPVKEEVIGDKEATAMLVRPYRQPWDGVMTRLKLA
jgi:predicted dehydrogenase